ncbi:LOW QUALITY PROTEIN: hypothetical protein BC938DRAFT_478931 [Jimgerdemannia flammicorona]|uniref:Uncharacterized protein n=1 Tax=Jimgerdemannia flammicorona TaxID=994334 RepID=A0A433QM08_9FUNG|nr:LOW QUALITY PROTEIN: hypothetical protein BC938DRAFT_478931 [Jimgerdemannia flammicorona]
MTGIHHETRSEAQDLFARRCWRPISSVYEATIPSSLSDFCNIEIAYRTMLGFVEKLKMTSKMLVDLNRKLAIVRRNDNGSKDTRAVR